jgi:ubiquinone/menaquinone biosynthesis C-methylase UbiE
MMRSYDVTANIYDMRYAEEQEAKYAAALETVKLTGAVLDVGCGTGLLFKHVADEAENAVGIDISKKLLLEARKRVHNHANFHLVRADADYLPFANDFFNVVFAFTVLQNMSTPVKTLKEMHRTAKVGASVVVTGLKKAFSKETFLELLEKAGFRLVSVKDGDNLKCYVAVCLKDGK